MSTSAPNPGGKPSVQLPPGRYPASAAVIYTVAALTVALWLLALGIGASGR